MSHETKNSIYYFICICIGATAFQVYSEGLSRLHWTYAGFLFSIMSWLSVLYLHHASTNRLHTTANLELPEVAEDKKWFELSRDEFITIFIKSILSFLSFALMLPFMNDQDTAIYFTLAGAALMRFLSIIAAQKLFGDKIGDKISFWAGFIICLIGIAVYIYPKFENGSWSPVMLTASLLWSIVGILSEQTTRYITVDYSLRKVKIPLLSRVRLSIKTQQEKSELFKTIFFGIGMIVVFFWANVSFSYPKLRELLSAFWIGYAVTVWGVTISQGFKNKIGETVSSILQSLRVVWALAFAPIIALIFSNPNSWEIWMDKFK
jgi:hypothetical protein